MKHFLALLLVFAMSFSMIACGANSVELTIPAIYVKVIPQESLDAMVSAKGYKSAKQNPDGSVTYVMSKAQHKEMITAIKTSIDLELSMLVNDNSIFAGITTNDDYTVFDVELRDDTIGLAGSFSIVAFSLGGLYNAFNGTTVDNISVNFRNPAGEIIQTANSKDLQT